MQSALNVAGRTRIKSYLATDRGKLIFRISPFIKCFFPCSFYVVVEYKLKQTFFFFFFGPFLEEDDFRLKRSVPEFVSNVLLPSRC